MRPGTSGRRPRHSPVRRVNPSGSVVWVARYRGKDGKRRVAKPSWNGGKGTFQRQRDAQRAIDEALDASHGLGVLVPDTVGRYFETWTQRHPRSKRTNETNEHRITRVLDCEVEGRPLREWPLYELRRRHASGLVEALLADQRRAVSGAAGVIRALSAMAEDAITDEVTEVNPFKGLRIRANDPRAVKASRPARVWSFEQMHAFAAQAGKWEPMVRTFADTGMRLGEVLPLRRSDWDGERFEVRRTAHEGVIQDGTKTDHGRPGAGRIVPSPPGLTALLRAMPHQIHAGDLLFPTPRGRLWRERNFYRDVWYPTQRSSGLDIRPHEMRHSYVSHLRAAGVDDADLAQIAGHRVETMLARYTHPLGKSWDRIGKVIG